MLKLDDRLMDECKVSENKNWGAYVEKIKEETRKYSRKGRILGIIASALVGIFAIGMLYNEFSNPKKEIENRAKTAQECLFMGDTVGATLNIEKGTQRAEEIGDYESFKEYMLPLIDQIYESKFYDKETGSLVFNQIHVNKPAGTIEYPRRYLHPWFPKEKENSKE